MKEKVLMAKVVKKDPEEKQYLICIRAKHGEDSWDIIVCRTETYRVLKEYIQTGDIDFEESFVLVERVDLEGRKSLYRFMKYAEQFYEDNFDIEDYVLSDEEANADLRDELTENNTVTSKYDLGADERVSMQDFMNGNIRETDVD